jgi:hypothetical protein
MESLMFDHNHYVPVLKWRMGEYQALLNLEGEVADWVTPLIEIPTEGWDFENEKPSKSLDDHLKPFGKRLKAKWGNAICFVDSPYLNGQAKMASGLHHVEHIFALAREAKCSAIPVTGLNRHPAYTNAIKKIIALDNRGVCLRLTTEDFTSELSSEINLLLKTIQLTAGDVDLVLDVADFIADSASAQALIWESLLDRLPHINDWNTLTVVATSFPSSLPAATYRPVGRKARTEWQAYKELVRNYRGRRIPSFGDYVTSHPVTASLDPRMLDPNAKIKYTINDEFFIVVGNQIKMNGREQYVDLCKRIIDSNPSIFEGASYSWADQYIADCATKMTGTGGTSTWPSIASNHHITKVVRDVASFHGSLVVP